MPDDKPSDFGGMPKWPKEAKELPQRHDAEPRRARLQWAIVGAGIGLILGGVVSDLDVLFRHGGPMYAGSVAGCAIIGILVGLLIERFRYDAAVGRWKRGDD